MRPLDYLRILRRRWWIIVIGALIGGLLAFATQPSNASVARQTAPIVRYRATNYILANVDSVARASSSVPISWDRLALYTIRGEVARNAVAKVGGTAVGNVVEAQASSSSDSSSSSNNSASRKKARASDASTINFRRGHGTLRVYAPKGIVDIAAVPDPSINGLSIVATGGAEQAPKAADIFASELIKFLDGKAVTAYQAQRANLNGQIADTLLTNQALQSQIAAAGANQALVQSLQQRVLQNQQKIDGYQSDLHDLERQGPDTGQYASLDSASNGQLEQIRTPGGTAVSSGQRLILGGAIGALLGLVLLIIMELLGARIRDVQGTEGAARMPVVAEIPVVKMNRADRFVVATAADPASLTAEAYRSLRTSLLAMWQRHPKNTPVPAATNGNGHGATNGNGAPNGNGARHGRPLRTLLVTSPGPAEGKSISVVNLAAAFAETGMSVIVVDSDFRRPTQCRYLDRPKSPNLADLDIACSPEDLEAVLQDTDVPGVRLAASAPTKSDPGHAIAVAKSAVAAARGSRRHRHRRLATPAPRERRVGPRARRRRNDRARPIGLDPSQRGRRRRRSAPPTRGARHRDRHRRRRARRSRRLLRLLRLLRLRLRVRPPGRGLDRPPSDAMEGRPQARVRGPLRSAREPGRTVGPDSVQPDVGRRSGRALGLTPRGTQPTGCRLGFCRSVDCGPRSSR